MHRNSKEVRALEICLLLVSIGLACLLYRFQGYKMVVLNLFYLPVVLGACYLGRYRAGILALFCVVASTIVATSSLHEMWIHMSPLISVLALVVWGAVLGMTALLVGTLSDERVRKSKELHEAYVGVVEVLSQYLQSANPHLKARSIRVAEVSQRVAEELKMTPQQIDDIRVAALLYDMADVEITAKVIRRAMGTLEFEGAGQIQHTFQGKDLVFSLGSVLSGAMSLLQDPFGLAPQDNATPPERERPLGSQIIRAVRHYDQLTQGDRASLTASEAIEELREDREAVYHPHVLNAIERIVSRSEEAAPALALT